MKLKEAYKDKKVFITGITGFKGSWLAILLNQLGAKVSGLGLTNDNKNSIFHQGNVSKFAKVYYADIRDVFSMCKLSVDINSSDYVFHLAAQPLVSEGYNKPFETMETNLMGTLILQEYLRCSNKEIKYLNVTTDKVYKAQIGLCKENDMLEGGDPYSLSKSFSDMITALYRNTYFKDNKVISKTARAGNVIGGGDWCKNRIVTDVINSLYNNDKLKLRNPSAVRPYQYVLDCLVDYLYINAYGTKDEYNVGPDTATTVSTEKLVQSFQKHNDDMQYSLDGKSIGKENLFLKLDNSLFMNEFKFIKKPYADNIDKVTKYTYEWYNNLYKNNIDMEQFSNQLAKDCLEYYEKLEGNNG